MRRGQRLLLWPRWASCPSPLRSASLWTIPSSFWSTSTAQTALCSWAEWSILHRVKLVKRALQQLNYTLKIPCFVKTFQILNSWVAVISFNARCKMWHQIPSLYVCVVSKKHLNFSLIFLKHCDSMNACYLSVNVLSWAVRLKEMFSKHTLYNCHYQICM